MSALGLGWHIMKERLGAGRMMVIWPLADNVHSVCELGS